MREYHARSTINIILCAGERAQLLFLTDIRAGKQMRERGPRGKAIGGKGVLAGKQMLGSLGFDIFSSPVSEFLLKLSHFSFDPSDLFLKMYSLALITYASQSQLSSHFVFNLIFFIDTKVVT